MGEAVVLGAGMAGLIAARVLSESYDTVTVVDRDALPETARSRRGVPQSRQLHILLARGRQSLDELFGGLTGELTAAGAPLVDLNEQVHWYNDGYLMRPAASDVIAVGVSRPLLEATVRARVRGLGNVTLRRAEATGLIGSGDRRRITGVLVTPEGGAAERLDADLVVDTCGRASRTPVWLDRLGYPAPPEQRVEVGVTYVTRTFRREPHHLGGRLGALSNALPERPRAGIVAVQEDNLFAVALSGLQGEEPPTDDDGFVRYAESLGAPPITRLVREATPVGEPARMRYPASVRRRYERLRRFPLGYLVMGDALCSFNPVYGQGMTVAAGEGLLLRELLAGDPDRLWRRFFRGAARLIDGPWSIAVGTDLRLPQIAGRRSPRVRLVNAYVHRLHAAARTDPVLGSAFVRVLNLMDPPSRLLRPAIALRVLRGHAGTGRERVTSAAAG